MKLIKVIIIIGILWFLGMKGYEYLTNEGYFESQRSSETFIAGQGNKEEQYKDSPL